MITDSRLKTFVAVADCGSFTRAALQLGLSQPAVSQCIAQLEAEAGGPLLTRGRGEVALTPLGSTFALYARRILKMYSEMDAALAAGAPLPQHAEFELPDGRTADVSLEEGKLQIALK